MTSTKYPKLILGYMTLAVLPTRPTGYPERQPMRACVTNIGDCHKKRRAGKPAYTEGCFLGDTPSIKGSSARLAGGFGGVLICTQLAARAPHAPASSSALHIPLGAAAPAEAPNAPFRHGATGSRTG